MPLLTKGTVEPARPRPSRSCPSTIVASAPAWFAGVSGPLQLLCSFFFFFPLFSRGGSYQCLRDPAPLILLSRKAALRSAPYALHPFSTPVEPFLPHLPPSALQNPIDNTFFFLLASVSDVFLHQQHLHPGTRRADSSAHFQATRGYCCSTQSPCFLSDPRVIDEDFATNY